MIDKDTPHKLAEIIRDTWPQLYRGPLQPSDKSDKIDPYPQNQNDRRTSN